MTRERPWGDEAPPTVRHRVRVPIATKPDVALADEQARAFAAPVGLSTRAMEALAKAVSEIAHIIVAHGRGGEITFAALEDGHRRGVAVTASGARLGSAVARVRRLVDEFELIASPDATTVNMAKWADSPIYGTSR